MVDNKIDNVSVVDGEILNTLPYASSVSAIAGKLGKRRSNVCRSLSKLVRLGLVSKRNQLYYISSSGVIKSVDTPNGVITPSMGKRQRLELHDVCFELYFWRVPDGWNGFRRRLGELDFVKDYSFNEKFRGGGLASMVVDSFTVKATTKGIIVYLPPIQADSPREGSVRVFKLFLEFVRGLGRRLRLPEECLVKEGRLNVKLHSTHYAFLKHEFTGWWVDKTKKEKFAVVDQEGRLRVWIDFSFPPQPHLEALTVEYGEQDASFVQDYFQPILHGDFMAPNEVKASIRGLSRSLGALEPVFADLNANLASHVKLTKEVAAAASSLNAALGVLRRRSVQAKGSQEVLWRWFKDG